MCSFGFLCYFYTTWLSSWTPKILPNTFDLRKTYWALICFTIWILLTRIMEASARSCCVPSCGKTRADNVVLHAFPDPEKEKERFITWVNAVGRSISSLDHQFIYKNRKICHGHFATRYLTWTRRLSMGAVPTLYMPGFQVEERVVMRDITNTGAATSHGEPMAVCSLAGGTSSEIPGKSIAMPMKPVADQQTCTGKDTTRTGKFIDGKKALAQMVKKLQKKNDSYAVRLKKALKLSENITFQNTLRKFTSLAALFLTMQFREVPKHKLGRRYTQQEKIMALSLYKQGPKCYRFLRKAFVLPSPLTLGRLIARANIRPGINEKLFKQLAKKVKFMKNDDKLCVLLFDEIAITPHFDYNRRKDAISGFVTDGKSREKKIADHALVFMIRGISRNYKQPIVYTFCSGSTKKHELAMLITNVIRKLHSVGLRVLATVCDQGASNVSCINHLIAETKAKYLRNNKVLKGNIFEIDDTEIIPVYDPPHLIKGIRNNLLNKNLKCLIDGKSKTAKWDHLIKLHEENPEYAGIRLIKNLTDNHINPEKCKMKVKFATQIFSQKVGTTMGYLADKKILPEECKDTADVILFFDELFDSVNGSYDNSKKRSGKPLLAALTPKSTHSAMWIRAKKVLSSMKFVKNNREMNIPSVTNWLHTINNVEYLRDILFNKYKIKSIWMRHFNQDPLENFFGAIRSHGCRNTNPTPEGFETAFASLLISNLTGSHSPGANCEQDSCSKLFKSLRFLFTTEGKKNNLTDDVDLSYMQMNIFVDFEIKKNDPRILAQLEYVTGYLLRQTKQKVFHNCVSCKNNLYSKSDVSGYVTVREYQKGKQNLTYPSNELVNLFSKIQDVMLWVLTNHSSIENIKNYAKTILYIEVLNFMSCEIHKTQNLDFMFELGCRFFICNWCKDVNNILKGRRGDVVGEDVIKNLALDYVSKRQRSNK